MIGSFFNSLYKKISKGYEGFSNFGPAKSLVVGFASLIFIGAVLLTFPFASRDGNSIGFLNAIFTSTSAVCVTGLVVANTLTQWTIFGKVVILILIQIGGLGFMSVVTGLFLFVGKKITLKDRLLIKESYNQHELSGMVRLVINIFKGTFIVEGICAFFLSIIFFTEGDHFLKAIAKGIFISISSFCNAGFDVIGDNSLMPYVGNLPVNLIVMFLIIFGGIGFAVWIDLSKIKNVYRGNLSFNIFVKRLSLHTKIVLLATFILILSGALFTFLIERNNPETLGTFPLHTQILASIFQAVTLRTAGFNTLDLAGMNNATKFFYIIEMYIGGSPGGTAGGIKTVTIGIIMVAIISAVRGNNKLEIFHRRIGIEILFKAISVIVLNIFVIIVATMALSITEINNSIDPSFLDLFFEATSAVGTVGLTLGITPYLSVAGRIIIILVMFIGRLGSITIAVAFAIKMNKNLNLFNYPEEKVIVG